MINKVELSFPVTVILFEQGQYSENWMPRKLTDAVAWLQGLLEQVPFEFRDKATIVIDSGGGREYADATIKIYYLRPPTDTDKQKRLDQERDHIAARENIERQTYERLKVKFG